MPQKLSREMLEALVDIQMNITKLEFPEMMDYLVNSIVKTLRVERCSIFRVFNEMVCLITGAPKEEHGIGMNFNSQKDLPLLKEVIDGKCYLFVENPGKDNRAINTRELIFSKGINAMLLIPLIAEQKVIGIIAVDATEEKRTFSEEEMSFCLILADVISFLLERDYLRKEKEKKEILTILGELVMEFSHEIRNPLMSIGGFAKRLKREINGNSLCEKELDIIIKEAKRLEDFIKKITSLSCESEINFIIPDNNLNIDEVFNRLARFKTSV